MSGRKTAMSEFERSGFAQFELALSALEVATFLDAIERRVPALAADATGLRNVTALVPETIDVLRLPRVASAIVDVLGADARLVRAILFDKTPSRNWNVPWHQDLFIATRERRETPGFSSWTTKDGVAHVRPPLEILQQMVILRIHLDDCTSESGPLLVVPATHGQGMIDDEARRRAILRGPVVECVGAAGSAVLLRPLLLHSSRQATRPSRRRVLHLELAGHTLAAGLSWHLDVPVGPNAAMNDTKVFERRDG